MVQRQDYDLKARRYETKVKSCQPIGAASKFFKSLVSLTVRITRRNIVIAPGRVRGISGLEYALRFELDLPDPLVRNIQLFAELCEGSRLTVIQPVPTPQYIPSLLR